MWEVKLLADVNIGGSSKANILAGHFQNGKSVLEKRIGKLRLVLPVTKSIHTFVPIKVAMFKYEFLLSINF